MIQEFQDRVAVITGGAQGLGFAIAALLGTRGADVVLLDIDEDQLDSATRRLAENDINACSYPTDVTDNVALEGIREAVLGEYSHIDILINSAGIYPRAGIREIDSATWDKMMAINAKGTFLATRTFMEPMIVRQSGRIVCIASGDAYLPKPSSPHYAASKAAVISLVRSFASELAEHQVLVNGISPGAIATEYAKSQEWLKDAAEKSPLKRVAEPEDIAEVAVFLASNRNRYMTGETIIVSGGDIMV